MMNEHNISQREIDSLAKLLLPRILADYERVQDEAMAEKTLLCGATSEQLTANKRATQWDYIHKWLLLFRWSYFYDYSKTTPNKYKVRFRMTWCRAL